MQHILEEMMSEFAAMRQKKNERRKNTQIPDQVGEGKKTERKILSHTKKKKKKKKTVANGMHEGLKSLGRKSRINMLQDI